MSHCMSKELEELPDTFELEPLDVGDESGALPRMHPDVERRQRAWEKAAVPGLVILISVYIGS